MRKILKQVVGIDVAKDELVICSGRLYEDGMTIELHGHKTFANTAKGFASLIQWVKQQGQPERFVMEATGVYHESLAYFLVEQQFKVSVVLPNKISNYFKTLSVKTITDKTASEAIAQFGLERKLDDWTPPNKVFKTLRQLTRERDQVITTRTIAKNQLHAEQSEYSPNSSSLSRIKKLIALLDKQEKEIQQEIKAIAVQDKELKADLDIVCSIPGVGLLTAVTVLAETNGFDLIRNKRQLTSYAGLDVREKQSGISVKGKPKISKNGNRYLRKSLHMPALAAIRHDDRMKGIFVRLVSKHGIKMKAAVAVQRKLLEMIYTLHKSGKRYDKDYFINTNQTETTVDKKLEESLKKSL